MGKQLVIQNYSSEELKALGRTHCIEEGIRFLAVYYTSEGFSSREIEEKIILLGRNQISYWVNRFNEMGLEGLKNKPRNGKKALLSEVQIQELKTMILNQSPENNGFNSGTWTAPLVSIWIKKQWNICLKPVSLYPILRKRMGLSYQKGKGFYPEAEKRNEAEEALKKSSIH